MASQKINLETTEISAIKGQYDHFKLYRSEFNKSYKIDPTSFLSYACASEDLFKVLQGIAHIWGSSNVNFETLNKIFESYLESHSTEVPKAFSVFTTISTCVAKIIENREFIEFEYWRNKRLLEATDSWNNKDEYNYDLIFSEQV